MTFSPSPLVALGRYWVAHGGVNLGIVGDAAHGAKGVSYHLGRDRLAPGAYSAQTARDKAGLSNAASALDLGKLGGSLPKLRAFSVWLVGQARESALGTSDIREVIWSPDGKVVLRWDRERGAESSPRAGEADTSHVTHTHISFYRDSERRSKVGLFAPYFVPLPDTSTKEVGVTVVTITLLPAPRKFTATAPLRRFTATSELAPIPAPYSATVDGHVSIEGNPSSPRGAGFLRLASGGSAGRYVLASQVTLE